MAMSCNTPSSRALLTLALCALVAPAGAADGTLPLPPIDADFAPIDPEEAALGWLLFYDPVLSGNRDIACATCHHPHMATSDGLSLGIGTGGTGLGPDRRGAPGMTTAGRVPRNAPALFNLGAYEFTTFFHDGRVEQDSAQPGGVRSPLGADLPRGFDSILSVQALFPMLSPEEMAGHGTENAIARAVTEERFVGPDGALDLLTGRVAAIPAYVEAFGRLHPHVAAGDAITITDITNALAAFMELEWRADNSAFDRHLRGEALLEGPAAEGMALFFGKAGCAACHSGPFQTDHGFHAMGQPQLGPGKPGADPALPADTGRHLVTGREEDRFAFRTPSLRNVTLTGPWGHAGAFSDLGDYLRHHLDPVSGIDRYSPQATMPAMPAPEDWAAWDDLDHRAAIARAVFLRPVALSEAEIAALLAFLAALEDPEAVAGHFGIPDAVPSGLPVDR